MEQKDATPEPSAAEKIWVGFDLGGTKMLSSVFDHELKPMERERKRTKGHEGSEFVVNRIIETIKKSLQKSEKEKSDIQGIGIGVPGPLDLRTGVVLEAPNLNWKNVPIRKILEDEFETKVVVCNDVDAGVYGEYRFGAGKGGNTVVGVFPGTGVGGGCVYEGKIFQGRIRTCMEVGHIPIVSGTMLDGAGNSGTLEAVASRLAISASAAQACYRGQAPILNKRTGADLSEIRSGALSDAYDQKEKAVVHILENAIDNLSLAVVSLIHLMSPDVVVLGGGLVEAMPKLFVDRTKKFVESRILDSFKETYEIRSAELGDDAAILGAAAWAKQSSEDQTQ